MVIWHDADTWDQFDDYKEEEEEEYKTRRYSQGRESAVSELSEDTHTHTS